MAEKVAAQQWRWRRSDGFGGAVTAMAMAAQRWGWQWWRRWRMSIALLSLRVAAICCSRLTPSSLRHMYFVFSYLVYTFST
jgi:hypothetical protein